MRNIILAALGTGALLVTAGAAQAAGDFKILNPAIGPTDFGGFYAGGHAGYAFVDIDGVQDNGASSPLQRLDTIDLDDFAGGVQAGFNYQRGNIVFGIEGDYSWLNNQGSRLDGDTLTSPDTFELEMDYLATVRGRLGVVSGNKMLYLTAGIGFTQGEFTVTNGDAPFNSASIKLRATGLALGGGLEWAVSDRLSVRAEYLHVNFDESVDIPNASPLPESDDGDYFAIDSVSTIRVGANYRFGARGYRRGGMKDGGDMMNASTPANFAGLYGGAHLGYAINDIDGVFDADNQSPLQRLDRMDLDNINGGFQAGFNFQRGNLLLGLEGDYSWMNASDSVAQAPEPAGQTNSQDFNEIDMDYLATLRGRAGFVQDNLLLYLTAGIAFTEAELTVTRTDRTSGLVTGTGSVDVKGRGLTYGGGVEWAINDNLSIKGEYLHMRFQDKLTIDSSTPLPSPNAGDMFGIGDTDVIRVGLNFRFSPSRHVPLK